MNANGYRVSLRSDKNVLKLDSGDGSINLHKSVNVLKTSELYTIKS